jgi:hypothetical protein
MGVLMKNKNIYFYFMIVVFLIVFIFVFSSCKINEDRTTENENKNQDSEATAGKISEGVISLLDSIGVGDVSLYPGYDYDKELNAKLGEFRNQLSIPSEFINVLYSVVVTNDTPAEVIDYYNSEMKKLEWEKAQDITSDKGGFMSWKKVSNYGKDVTYIVVTGEIQYAKRVEVVVLTGVIIPERDDTGYTETTREGNEIGPGSIYFKNPTPPEGEGLLSSKPVSMGIGEWKLWLQEGSKTKGINKVYLKDDPVFGKIVEFYRTSDPDDGGAAGIYQGTKIELGKYSSVKVWLVGKVLKENGGNIANVNPSSFPEGAVNVRIKYLTEDDYEKEWYHSFFYSNIIYYDKLHYSFITKEEQFWYISPNLLELEEKPAMITEIRVYGFGWDFTGQIAEINIIGN